MSTLQLPLSTGSTAFDRVMARVEVRRDGCWICTLSLTRDGYARVRLGGRGSPMAAAHRVVFEHVHGRIPEGMCICHTCDVRACVNPDHLWLGTNAENAADKVRKRRQAAKLTELDVRIIRARCAVGVSPTVIARAFGVTPRAVSKIANGDTWRHV